MRMRSPTSRSSLTLTNDGGRRRPPRLLGDFAFVVVDASSSEVFAARDPMGVRPLFYWQGPDGRIRLASEKQALFADGSFEPKVDPTMLALAVAEEYLERDETLIEGVRSIPPGSWLHWSPRGTTVETYWTVDARRSPPVRNADEAGACLAHTLDQAVEARMRAIGSVATHASGGLDSSTVSAIAVLSARKRAALEPILVMCRYDREACDELAYAARVAEHLDVELSVFDAPMQPGAYPPSFDIDRCTEPYAQLLEGMAASFRPRGARVLLSGLGADELQLLSGRETDQALFDGDVSFAVRASGIYGEPFAWKGWRRLLGAVKRRTFPTKRAAPASVATRLPRYATDMTRALLSAYWPRLRRELNIYDDIGPARQFLLGRFTHGLSNRAYAQDEQIAAKLGVCVRHPFLDLRVVELLLSLPTAMIFDPDMSKPVLRRVARDVLPPSIAYRTSKCIFAYFFHALWQREAAAYRPLLEESLLEEMGFVERGSLARMVREQAGDVSRLRELIMAVTLETWLRGLRDARREAGTAEQSLNLRRGLRILW